MSVQLEQEKTGKILHVRASQKLTKEDYRRFVPRFEKLIEEHGKIRVLFEMQDFHGWELSALWADLKLDFKHFNHVERIAMVGNRAWQEGMSYICKPFTTAKVRYFNESELEKAKRWLEEGLDEASRDGWKD